MNAPPEAPHSKGQIRTLALARRRDAHRQCPDAGTRLAARFPAALLPAPGAVFAAYRPVRDEIDPRPLETLLLGHGARLALPAIEAAHPGLVFRLVADESALERDRFGISAPRTDAPIARPQLILVPLVAFDRDCHRLGYGRGYYDTALAALRADGGAPIFALGLAFAAQGVDSLPAEPHDQSLDAVLTPDFCRARTGRFI